MLCSVVFLHITYCLLNINWVPGVSSVGIYMNPEAPKIVSVPKVRKYTHDTIRDSKILPVKHSPGSLREI